MERLYFCRREEKERDMNVAINNSIYQRADMYAKQQGVSLKNLIEHYLLSLVNKDKQKEEVIPDVVLNLIGAAGDASNEDLNGREEYYRYVEEKYK